MSPRFNRRQVDDQVIVIMDRITILSSRRLYLRSLHRATQCMVAAFGGMRIHLSPRIRISPALSVAAGAWRRKGTPLFSRAGMGCLLPLSSSYSSSKAVALVAGHQGRGPVVPRIVKGSSIRQIAGLCAELGKARLRCVGPLMFVPKSRRLVNKRGKRIL
jgi:hypothetical protein